MKKFVMMVVMMIVVLSTAISYAISVEELTDLDYYFIDYVRNTKPEECEVFARFAVGYRVSEDYYIEEYVILSENDEATTGGWAIQIVNGEVAHNESSSFMWNGYNENNSETFEIVKDNEYRTMCNIDDFVEMRKEDGLNVEWVKYY